MPNDAYESSGSPRRQFLQSAGGVSLAAMATAAGAVGASAAAPAASLPQIAFGKHSFSRLICGANPFNAGSHLSTFVNQEMRQYFTPERVVQSLRRCVEVGINCWQNSGVHNIELYRRLVDGGTPMQMISLGRDPKQLPQLAAAGCLGVAHHGEVSDQLFKAGKLEPIGDFLKQVRDAGMMAGVSTHMPEVVDAIESRGWEVDYYMTCVYQRNRSAEELKRLLGYVPLPPNEVYLTEDPPRMFQSIQQTKRICLAFKILAAGRLSDRKEWVERAYRDTFKGIKPTDGVIVGLYDRYSDQAAEGAALTRKYG